MATFQSGGLSLAYDDIRPAGGEAGTIVLVHGFATSRAENWRRLGWYGAFERKGWRTIAFDHRGHGESDKPHEASAYGRAAMVGDLMALMDHLGVGQAALMGYSMGAHVCLRAALDHGERFSHLILGGVGERMLPGRGAPLGGGTMTMAEAMRAPDASAITEPTLKGFRQFAEQQGEDLLALAACSEGISTPLDADELYGLRMPVLVVAGARDQLAGDPQVLADAIPGAKAVTLPACDHFSAIPHALYKAAVFDFLEGWLDDDMPPFE
ncbi:MAG TPA: alpha/beta hydrolase [Caulobacteraceae bacterium]|nr:alpha/beta hydrolase [Caulobacteraceae bacterium]